MNIRFGDEGNIVREIQQMLVTLGYEIEVDGIFGRKTEQAVTAFQEANDLDADGIVGVATREALEAQVVLFENKVEPTEDDSMGDGEIDRHGEAPEAGITGIRPNRVVTFPSGSMFHESEGLSRVDFRDHVGDAAIPLIDVEGREDEMLSENFTVRELRCRDGSRYARISPQLVVHLQTLRNQLEKPIRITSAYRHIFHNRKEGGKKNSQHIAGRAVDLVVRGMKPIDLAEAVLEVFGCNVGIGLGKNIVHIDLRGRQASWVYENTPMSETAFDSWVARQCADDDE